jgi:Pyrimidine dimer DNA glycosylase
MRLWCIHPKYLDPLGLVALWREALLARAVLRGMTTGYTRHPQLQRFRAHSAPRLAINLYLLSIHAEASSRGYSFDKRKIGPIRTVASMSVTSGQLAYEWQHLLGKLRKRHRRLYLRWRSVSQPQPHPSFRVVPGAIALWERPGGIGPRLTLVDTSVDP